MQVFVGIWFCQCLLYAGNVLKYDFICGNCDVSLAFNKLPTQAYLAFCDDGGGDIARDFTSARAFEIHVCYIILKAYRKEITL